MRRRNSWSIVLALCALVATATTSSVAYAAKFRILVGNDDGVGAPGLSELVKVLSADSVARRVGLRAGDEPERHR